MDSFALRPRLSPADERPICVGEIFVGLPTAGAAQDHLILRRTPGCAAFEAAFDPQRLAMVDGPAGGRGKWSRAGMPHKGWRCINTEDLGAPAMQCEMCEATTIRFVQFMRHPDYRAILACGATCAGHLEQDLARAERREKAMKSNARRRAHFPARKGWYRNHHGNWQIKVSDMRVTIFQKPNGWGGVVQRGTGESAFTRERFPSFLQAQLAAFDAMTFLQGADSA